MPASRRRPPHVSPRGGTVCLAASPGGHLAELQAVSRAVAGRDHAWVTGASGQAEALRAGGEEVRLLPAWGRDPPGLRGLPANVRAARTAVRELEPGLVITTGAGMVVPFVLLARRAGAAVILIESMARVRDASLTGRILAPLARAVLVQWPEMRSVLRRATVCRPALLEAGLRAGPPAGEGTFASVGTRPEPFDRLLAMVDRAVSAGILPRPVVAQSGTSTYVPASFRPVPWMEPGDVARAVAAARYVVCHGGAGMVSAVIAGGRRPLVLPRIRGRGEHRTEHQSQLVERLAAAGAVVELRGEIGAAEVAAAGEPPAGRALDLTAPSVEDALRAEIEAG